MTNKSLFTLVLLAISATALVFNSCKKDEDPKELTLLTLLAGEVDLNAATSATSVPINPTIVATFSTDIDAATATAANVKLTQDYDDTEMELSISVSGNTISITPVEELGTGMLYQLLFSGAIQSTEGMALTEINRNFTTIGTFAPAGVIAHWTFEDNANDIAGDFNPSGNGVVDITYVESRNAEAGKAASFNGTSSIIEIPNGDQLINSSDFTISFWVKTRSEGHVNENGDPKGHFVMGLGAHLGLQFEIFGGYDGAKFAVQYEFADGGTGAEDMWFPALADYNETGGWQGWDFAKSLEVDEMQALLRDNWLHVTFTYDGPTKKATLYYNGEKMKSFDFNLWPEEDPKTTTVGIQYAGSPPDVVNEFAFGFIQSRAGTMWNNEPWGGYDFPTANHFGGELDDVRIFHKALTPTEIQLMYNSEKP